jgi:hypothetical protein
MGISTFSNPVCRNVKVDLSSWDNKLKLGSSCFYLNGKVITNGRVTEILKLRALYNSSIVGLDYFLVDVLVVVFEVYWIVQHQYSKLAQVSLQIPGFKFPAVVQVNYKMNE